MYVLIIIVTYLFFYFCILKFKLLLHIVETLLGELRQMANAAQILQPLISMFELEFQLKVCEI